MTDKKDDMGKELGEALEIIESLPPRKVHRWTGDEPGLSDYERDLIKKGNRLHEEMKKRPGYSGVCHFAGWTGIRC